MEAEVAGRRALTLRGGTCGLEGGRLLIGKRMEGAGLKGKTLQLLSARGVGADTMNKPLPHLAPSHMPTQEEKEIIVFPLKEQKHYHSGGRRTA